MFNVADTVASRMKASADAAGKTLPFQYMSSGDIDQRPAVADLASRDRRSRRRNEAASSDLGERSRAASSAGAAPGATDPYNIPSMAIPLEGLGILGTAAAVGGCAGADAGGQRGGNAPYNEQISPATPRADRPSRTSSGPASRALSSAGASRRPATS